MLSMFLCVYWPYVFCLWKMYIQINSKIIVEVLGTSLLSDAYFINIFFQCDTCFFTLLIVSLAMQKFLSLI